MKKDESKAQKLTDAERSALLNSYKKRKSRNILRLSLIFLGLVILIFMLYIVKHSQVNVSEKKKLDLEQTTYADDTVYTNTLDMSSILTSGKPVLISFGAEWCEPCKRFDPILEEVKEELGDSVIIKIVDVDKSPLITSQYPLVALPSQALYTTEGVAYNPKDFIGVNNFKTYKASDDSDEPELTLHQGELSKSETLTVLNALLPKSKQQEEPVSQEQLERDEKVYSTQLHSDKYNKKHKLSNSKGSSTSEDSSRYETIGGEE